MELRKNIDRRWRIVAEKIYENIEERIENMWKELIKRNKLGIKKVVEQNKKNVEDKTENIGKWIKIKWEYESEIGIKLEKKIPWVYNITFLYFRHTGLLRLRSKTIAGALKTFFVGLQTSPLVRK